MKRVEFQAQGRFLADQLLELSQLLLNGKIIPSGGQFDLSRGLYILFGLLML